MCSVIEEEAGNQISFELYGVEIDSPVAESCKVYLLKHVGYQTELILKQLSRNVYESALN